MRLGDLTPLHHVGIACACRAYRCLYNVDRSWPAEFGRQTSLLDLARRLRCERCGQRPWHVTVYREDAVTRQPTAEWVWDARDGR